MNTVLRADELEKLLVANWTRVLDHRKVMAQVLQEARNADLVVTPSDDLKAQGVRLQVSRFELVENGFTVWFDFSVRRDEDRLAVGTTEMLLNHTGQLSHVKTVGNLFVRQRPGV